MSHICRLSNRLSFPLVLLLALILASTAQAEYLGNITFDQPSHSFLPHDLHVNVSIDYKIDDPAGRRIYVMPFTNGSPTPNFAVFGSVVYPQGTGTANSYFTITAGSNIIVDEVRVYTRDPDFTETPLEIFVPVFYRFGPHGVYHIETSHFQYSRLPHDMDLIISFEYGVDALGCKIYARPFTNGSLTPGYGASGSVNLPPSGASVQNFSFDADADITDIRFQIFALDNTTLLDEFFVPFDCHWREWGIYDISLNHGNVTSLHNSQNLVGSFTFDHQEAGDFYVWIWSIQDGGYCPGSVYQGSSPEPAGPHPVTRYTRVNNGTETVDAVRIIVGRLDEIYMEFDMPVLIDYGPHALQNFDFNPASPAIMTNGEHLDMTFDYLTDEASGVRIYARAAYLHNPLMGISSAGSPLYPAPSGMGDFWMTYNTPKVADSIRFQMVSEDQSVMYFEWFQPGYFIWGASGSVSDVTDTPSAVATLGLCFPNPFNPTATIPVNLGRDTHVRLTVYDVRGRLVRTLHDGSMPAGNHVFTFRGDGLSSGAYICRLETPAGVQTQRLTLIK
jgi:hypothetical protein